MEDYKILTQENVDSDLVTHVCISCSIIMKPTYTVSRKVGIIYLDFARTFENPDFADTPKKLQQLGIG